MRNTDDHDNQMSAIKFEGWLGLGPDSATGKMEWGSFEPKAWTENDVDIQISHCGICGSDLHTLRSGWGKTDYPCCVGHEIVGKAVRVGSNVRHIRLGDRVGVGAQARSCLRTDCPDCSRGEENACVRERVDTYGSIYPNGEGKSMGGYADYNRTNGRFVFKIPDGLPSEAAAPMLCGGITVYAPLKNYGCGPGKTVGIIGLGGLGHFGVLFAKAMGADRVVAISRRRSKKGDALTLGADEYIATLDDEKWARKNRRTLDLLICTVSNSDMPLQQYLSLLKWGGSFIQVGSPDGGKLPEISAFTLIMNNIQVGGSNIGSVSQIQEMLEFAVRRNVKPWIQTRPMKDANQAIVDMEDGKARYRYVLVNERHF
ncbi:NADP-dependent alcohol dehydrogenase 7 [Colletotrichum gloeosporioides]|uniref:alcohol dehydrogenase (NADP(+)) n=1 Tax=Colletotrichum gloeosporioides TaxID=474922 RepID=A0A8H4CER2_COLGL|nr:NADP-dependent alcohol dehydrogenase 7 [Colletotrichum gloeosporioides]KAF3802663.1 NADP-dependent alcohol dehydrogenase 7 [Colletotrichum gloeosporioides]